MRKMIIAIDGPSGTGKSTTAKMLAAKLNLHYIDSGAYYRTITYLVIKNNIKPNDIKKIDEIAMKCDITFKNDEIFLGDENITSQIRGLEVTNKVSSVSKIKSIRAIVNEKLRNYATKQGVVIDGRDIGTVVFPNADYKFYLTCDIKTRAHRRKQDFLDLGQKISLDKIILELQKRDEIDMKRQDAPLKKAEDAEEVDTTNMIIEEQVDYLYKKILSAKSDEIE